MGLSHGYIAMLPVQMSTEPGNTEPGNKKPVLKNPEKSGCYGLPFIIAADLITKKCEMYHTAAQPKAWSSQI